MKETLPYGSCVLKVSVKKLSSLFFKLLSDLVKIISCGSLFQSLTTRLLKNMSR